MLGTTKAPQSSKKLTIPLISDSSSSSSTDQNEFSIMLCGSARVGKSTLINALCGRKLAETSASLNSCTQETACYRFSGQYNTSDQTYASVDYTINFWDTPGIESWNEQDVYSYVQSLLNKTHPLCMIYCASPGSFAGLDQLRMLLKYCISEKIFCALVCTNMWGGNTRNEIIKEFKQALKIYHSITAEEDGVTYFGNIGLVTMVNSELYIDNELGVKKKQQGINELIYGIAMSLDPEKLIGWFYAVSENRSFWTLMQDKLSNPISEFLQKLPLYISDFFQGKLYGQIDQQRQQQKLYMPTSSFTPNIHTPFTTAGPPGINAAKQRKDNTYEPTDKNAQALTNSQTRL